MILSRLGILPYFFHAITLPSKKQKKLMNRQKKNDVGLVLRQVSVKKMDILGAGRTEIYGYYTNTISRNM